MLETAENRQGSGLHQWVGHHHKLKEKDQEVKELDNTAHEGEPKKWGEEEKCRKGLVSVSGPLGTGGKRTLFGFSFYPFHSFQRNVMESKYMFE